MDRFKQAIAGQATGSARLYSGSGEAGSNQGLQYGQTMFVLYGGDGRRWTANKEKEYPLKGEAHYYTRLVKQASHQRTDLCFAKVIEDGGGMINNLMGFVRSTASGREARDPRVMYGDKVVMWAWIDGGRYLRATSLVGWLQFCQSRPEIQADARGDNVWILKPSDPDKQGKQVQFGDSVVLESARYPGYYVSEQVSARGKYCRLTNDPVKVPLTLFQLGWSPNSKQSGGIIPPFFSAKEADREAKELQYTAQQAAAFGNMHPSNNNNAATPGESRPASVAPARPTTGPHLTGTAALQQTMSNYASNAAQQRYSSNPTQFFNDMQGVGENPFMRSVATSAAKSFFKTGP